MSHGVDEYYTIYQLDWRRASGPHECDACGETIAEGHRYCAVFYVFEKQPQSLKRCAKCEAIHAHLREVGERSEMWPDEKLDCGQDYEEHWGREPPPEIAAIAFMTPEEAQKELVNAG